MSNRPVFHSVMGIPAGTVAGFAKKDGTVETNAVLGFAVYKLENEDFLIFRPICIFDGAADETPDLCINYLGVCPSYLQQEELQEEFKYDLKRYRDTGTTGMQFSATDYDE